MSFTAIVIKRNQLSFICTCHCMLNLFSFFLTCAMDVENNSARCLCTDLGKLILLAILLYLPGYCQVYHF